MQVTGHDLRCDAVTRREMAGTGHAGGSADRGPGLAGQGWQRAAGAYGLELKALCCNKFRVFVILDKFPPGGSAVASDGPRSGDAGVHGIAQGF